MTNAPVVRSDGDLEVVILHESHGALAQIIGPDLYSIGGTPPEQSILFHNRPCFDLFLVHLVEFAAEGQQSAFIDEKFRNLSLFSGLRWFCDNNPMESDNCGLSTAISNIETWIEKEVPIQFWCPEVELKLELPLKNSGLISFGANRAKHSLLRLSMLIGKLERLCKKTGYEFSPQQLSAVLSAMIEEVNSRLQYHSSYLVEMLGNVFFSINAIIKGRFDRNPTNRVSEMTMPEGVTSDIFEEMYGSVMIFKRYDDSRITSHIPITTRYLKSRY